MSETDGWTKVAELDEIPEEGVLGIETDDETPIALVRTEGEIYALRDVCSHAEVRLSEGEVEDGTIECWLHGSCFDLKSGAPINPPATRPVPTYDVKIDGDDVLVSLDEKNS
ncbi:MULTISPECIES: non-heme iron oxygenase ferredoxin subunit [Nocardiopsis]|jgi:3-phenylpropionate/trans-cinnamate dioxygenase ferredoxin subunit|uniref:Non-heme iron oxygenase ferredoxin subunit n=2 Tax=Nocardiopsis alba TaxID=53437 RepID=A0A7K2IM86_9ACTN|nr:MULTISPECIES: non-heme iron oxygenase ferredoxin subunit [Nocardiopsis]AFR09467.1 rieske domain protein [Nocardiopsis alba ATCC BAA-2165]MEC3894578.1 non-heme iron oxygenase ferredoxin subunit [Nocardiopsis sp. LDBS1602]MYR31063.1 Rieske 2Fe-2S domain-containing protein [Nocardiopsis alba]